MIEVKKKDGESSEALLRRFSRKVQQSGLILRAKKAQFRSKVKSKTLRRKDAVKKSKIRGKIEYLKRIGKFEEIIQRGKSSKGRKK